MNERERFENAFPKLDLRREEDKYFSLHTNAYWVVWQAALSTRKPYGYGIVDKEGKPYLSDATAFDKEALNRTTELLNDEFPDNEPYQVVELFYEDKE